MNEILQRLAALSPKKRELMLKQLKKRGLIPTAENDPQIPSIVPVSREHPLLLSFTQQQVWRMEQNFPYNTAYNMFRAMRLHGQLDVAILQQCFHEVIRRHESLRTTVAVSGEQVVQEITESPIFSLPVIDLRGMPEDEQLFCVQQFMKAETQCPLDIVRGPCIRVKLLWLANEDHVLMLTLHQIVADEKSILILLREIAILYAAFSKGRNSPLPELPFQYADFAVWQRKRLQDEPVEKKLAYWRKQLAGCSILNLPTDRPRQSHQTFQAAKCMVEIAQSLTEALRDVSRQEKVTLFITMLTAFKMLLHHYSGQNDLAVGTYVIERFPRELEEYIGPFTNPLVLRTNISGDPAFRELLAQVRKTVLQAYAHQEIPFEVLLEQHLINNDRHLNKSYDRASTKIEQIGDKCCVSPKPLFQVMFVLHNFQIGYFGFPEIDAIPLILEQSSSVLDIDFVLHERQEGLSGSVMYNIALFDAEMIVRMVKQYRILLKHITVTREFRLSQLPLVVGYTC